MKCTNVRSVISIMYGVGNERYYIMGYDFYSVCKCGNHYSEYTVKDGIRICRGCGKVLSVHGIFTQQATQYGKTNESR